jgi:multimeric flavodoxin WrbA
MKVLLINGSPHPKGSTYTALSHVAKALEAEGIETDLRQIGHKVIRGCMACGKCAAGDTGLCVFDDDPVNEFKGLIEDADGLVVGAPVYYSGPNATVCAFLDRVFFGSSSRFALKPAAAVVSCRRGGASASFDRLNKYFTISSMPVVSSAYWNSIHGHNAAEAAQDAEGIYVMETLGRNMAWLLKCIELGKGKVPLPEHGLRPYTNFIR